MEGPRRPIIPQEVRNDELINASINIIPSKHRDPTPTWSKVIGRKLNNESISDVYARCRMNLVRDTVLFESPNFMDFGLSSIDTTDELGSVFASTTRIVLVTHGYDLIPSVRYIIEATSDRVSGTKAKNHYNFKSEYETRREKVVDQDFGHQNDPTSLPPLDLTPIGTNITN